MARKKKNTMDDNIVKVVVLFLGLGSLMGLAYYGAGKK